MGLFALALLAAGAVLWAIDAVLPPQPVPDITVKLGHLRVHGSEIDTLFLGSSRIYHQISPSIFDRTMTTHGHRVRSFNFGIKGMFPPESLVVLRRILAQRPRGLRWIFIEAVDFRDEIRDEHRGTVRALHWHDLHGLGLILRSNWHFLRHFRPGQDDIDDLTGQVKIAGDHLSLYFLRKARVGALSERWLPEARHASGEDEQDEAEDTDALGPARDGYMPREVIPLPGAELKKYRKTLENLRTEGLEPTKRAPFTERIFAEVAAEIRRAGITPILLITPTISPSMSFQRAETEADRVPVFAFNDPAAFPALYEPGVRSDSDHLNHAGAERFSVALAERFAAYLAAQKGAPDKGPPQVSAGATPWVAGE